MSLISSVSSWSRFADLIGEVPMAVRQSLQGHEHGPAGRVVVGRRTTPGQGVDQSHDRQAAVLLPHRRGGGDQLLADLDLRGLAGLDRGPAGVEQRPQRVDQVGLRSRFGATGQHRTGRLVGIERVGLAPAPSHCAVGAGDLTNVDPRGLGHPGDPGAVGAGAFDPHRREASVADQERQRCPVSHRGGRELGVPEWTAALVDHRDVDGVGVGVDPTDDHLRLW